MCVKTLLVVFIDFYHPVYNFGTLDYKYNTNWSYTITVSEHNGNKCKEYLAICNVHDVWVFISWYNQNKSSHMCHSHRSFRYSLCCWNKNERLGTVVIVHVVTFLAHALKYTFPSVVAVPPLGTVYFLRDSQIPFTLLTALPRNEQFHPRPVGPGPAPNIISISCLRTRAPDRVHFRRVASSHDVIASRCATPVCCMVSRVHPCDAFFIWRYCGAKGPGERERENDGESCGLYGLSTVDGWWLTQPRPAGLISVGSCPRRRDSVNGQIFYKRLGNWHGLYFHFHGSAGISHRLIVTCAIFSPWWISDG